jgi:DNA invertase Pin-like site-specific DNA recombinase
LLPKKEDRIVRKLLFELATWHSLAKLRLHTETTVTDLENSATRLGHLLRKFKSNVCSVYATRDLPSEEAARGRRQAAKAGKAGKKPETPTVKKNKNKNKPKLREFTMETYKLHGLPDYPAAIRAHGVTENTSTKNVCYL